MRDLSFDPAVSDADGFFQTIQLHVDGKAVGTARWHALQGGGDGVVQIVDFHVLPPCQRRGHGRRLMGALVEQVRTYHAMRGVSPRRLWVGLRHKTHVIARAFFASQGFTHVATVKDLLVDEDLLVYIRAFN